ncbi:MAG: hypothetical protein HZC41_22475 [Chloroflexi bacterium]|nr:hypothetical protein [Chloroflexota bacterium]
MFAKKMSDSSLIGQQFKYFTPNRLFGFDLTYYRRRDGAPVLIYRFQDMDDFLLLEPVEETCTPDEMLELHEIIHFHAGTEHIH